MVEKKEGNKMNCLNCGSELICGWSKPSGGYAPKLQWQNKDGTAHFTRFDGSKYVCPVEKEDDRTPKETADTGKISKPTNSYGSVSKERTPEQKVIDSIQMVELLWCPALEKAKEVYKIPETVTEPQTNKDVMILAQVFFKAMVEQYTSGEKC